MSRNVAKKVRVKRLFKKPRFDVAEMDRRIVALMVAIETRTFGHVQDALLGRLSSLREVLDTAHPDSETRRCARARCARALEAMTTVNRELRGV